MRKLNKLAAAVTMALSMGVTSQQAHALIELESNGRGDALLFPVFVGMAGWENYYAITNDSAAWIQGHLRFRGAAWSGELRDFDVILSPGDVFVFRLADVDGDGMWEIDESLDERNFQYTGLLEVADQGNTNLPTSNCTSAVDSSTVWKCMDPSLGLVPQADSIVTQNLIDYQTHVGYIEFIGEAVLDNMNHDIMAILLSGVPGDWSPYQTDVFSKRGTSAWKWSNAENQFEIYSPARNNGVWSGDRGLSDVPNVLAGVGFISQVGSEGNGLGFNAEAFVNFRTRDTEHRIDNYRIDKAGNPLDVTPKLFDNRAVIVHHENGASSAVGVSPAGDYVYSFREEDKGGDKYEGLISFNNTWGPTLADGDDYNMTRSARNGENVYGGTENLRFTTETGSDRLAFGNGPGAEADDFDVRSTRNSIAEVEEAIRVGGQHYSGYYFDGGAPGPKHQGIAAMTTWFFALFPTKFFYGEEFGYYNQKTFNTPNNPEPDVGYLPQAVRHLVMMPKTYEPQVWDIDEHTAGVTKVKGECVSPATIESGCFPTTIGTGNLILAQELSVFNIQNIKQAFSDQVQGYMTGRVGLFPLNNDPVSDATLELDKRHSWPGLMYSFEWGSDDTLAHWRMMHH